MPTIPPTTVLNASAMDIINAIRNAATANFREYVPVANTHEDVRQIGATIMQYPFLQNEFLSTLVNRIGMVIMNSKSYTNPWAMFKRGMVEYGESVEEIFVNLAKAFTYDADTDEQEVFKREIPDVRSAFHILNFQKFYKVTIQEAQLRQAFLAPDGLTDLVTKITNSMYAASNNDEFQTMKYLVARHILDGQLYPVTVPTPNKANAEDVVTKVKATSNDFAFMKPDYNMAHVHNFTMKPDQYLIVSNQFDSIMNVSVLAAAFHMEKAEFEGHLVRVDSFGDLDNERLGELFGDSDWYEELSAAQKTALAAVPGVLVDKDWFMIFDNLLEFTEQYNGQGLYWNYWYHTWKTFSVSPFANGAMFIPGTPAITSVAVSPNAVTLAAGQSIQLTPTVVTENFAPQSVTYEVTEGDPISVAPTGKLLVNPDAAAGEYTVTVKSTYDSTKTATVTVTVE